MDRQLRLTLVITAMGCGGAERVMAELANDLAGRGHRVTLLVLYPGRIFYRLDPQVTVTRLPVPGQGVAGRVSGLVSRPWQLRRQLVASRPEVVLSFIDVANTLTLTATLGLPVPVVVCERTYPPRHQVKLHYRLLRRLLYQRARSVVVQTSHAREWALRWLPAEQVQVIANPARSCPSVAEEHAPEISLPTGKRLVSLGRLGPEKGFDHLIQAFSRIADRHPEWTLLILGEGEMRGRLQEQITELGLSGRVQLPGAVRQPHVVLQGCDLFALSSRYEGFPNALCEAMACALPVISYDCAAGPADIIRHQTDGLLVPPGDIVALSEALSRLMGSPAERTRMAAAAAEIVDRFDSESIVRQWQQLLQSATDSRESGAGLAVGSGAG